MAPVARGLGAHTASARRDERARHHRASFHPRPDQARAGARARGHQEGPRVRGRPSRAGYPHRPCQLSPGAAVPASWAETSSPPLTPPMPYTPLIPRTRPVTVVALVTAAVTE